MDKLTTIYCDAKDCIYNNKNNHKCILKEIHYSGKCLNYTLDMKYLRHSLHEHIDKLSSKVGRKSNE